MAFSCSDDDGDTPGVGGTGGSGTAGRGNGGSAGSSGASAGTGGSSTGGSGTGGSGTGGSATAGAAGSAGSAGAAGAAGAAGSGGDGDGDGPDAGGGEGDAGTGDDSDDGTMTFFVTSDGIGDGGNLGGLDGADAFCTELAVAVDADFGRRTWHAYLSTTDEDARDRIGAGPWRNQAGVIIANNLVQLHDQGTIIDEPDGTVDGTLNETWPVGDLTIALDEQGNQVPNNVHDILTGTQADGTLDPGLTCEDWTSDVSDEAIQVRVGHSNRTGGEQPESFSTTHPVGCSQDGAENITTGGGRGSIYCFAVINGD